MCSCENDSCCRSSLNFHIILRCSVYLISQGGIDTWVFSLISEVNPRPQHSLPHFFQKKLSQIKKIKMCNVFLMHNISDDKDDFNIQWCMMMDYSKLIEVDTIVQTSAVQSVLVWLTCPLKNLLVLTLTRWCHGNMVSLGIVGSILLANPTPPIISSGF